MNKVAFYAGLIVLAVGLGIWILRPNESPSRTAIKFLGFEFSFDKPAFAVMVIGIALMILSSKLPAPAPITKVVCTGESEQNCPGSHDMFFSCGNFGSDDQIADNVCNGIRSGVLRLKTVGGGTAAML
jgi:hypothetical protein